VNDVGKQLVMLAWGIEHLTDKDLQELPERLRDRMKPEDIAALTNLATEGIERGKEDHSLVRFYRAASALNTVDKQVQDEITAWVQAIEHGDKEALLRVRSAADRVLKGIRASLDRLGVHLDNFAWESNYVLDGSVFEVAKRLRALPQAREEEGAFMLDLEHLGIEGKSPPFVFLRSDGTTLYPTRDIAYHLDKARRCDRGLNVLGEDQKLAAQQVAAALKLLGSAFQPECLFYSFVSLPEGKMSTRKGRVVTLDDLLDEAVDLALEEVAKRRPELPESERKKIAQAVGVGAVRFNIVRVQAEKGIVFRWEEALNFEGSSAPFVQYAHARACSILRKAGQADLIDAPEKAAPLLVEPWLLAEEPSCVALARTLERLPLVIEESAASVRPHPVATYALEAASAFNDFYRDVPVIGSDVAQAPRLALVAASRAALESILNLLAVAPLREM